MRRYSCSRTSPPAGKNSCLLHRHLGYTYRVRTLLPGGLTSGSGDATVSGPRNGRISFRLPRAVRDATRESGRSLTRGPWEYRCRGVIETRSRTRSAVCGTTSRAAPKRLTFGVVSILICSHHSLAGARACAKPHPPPRHFITFYHHLTDELFRFFLTYASPAAADNMRARVRHIEYDARRTVRLSEERKPTSRETRACLPFLLLLLLLLLMLCYLYCY